MTVGQLADELATELGESYSDADVARQFERWVVEAVEELYHAEKWNFAMGSQSVETVGGTALYTLDATVGSVRQMVDAETGYRLRGMTREELVRAAADLTDTGMPVMWCIDGSDDNQLVLRLWPVPSDVQTYTLYVTNAVGVLEDSTDEIPLPADCVRTLRHSVRAMFHSHEGNDTAAARHDGKYQEALSALRERYLRHSGLETRIRFGDISHSTPPLGSLIFPGQIEV